MYPPTEEVEIHRGAWNTGHHWGGDFAQRTGSLLQKKGWDVVRDASAYYQRVKRLFDQRGYEADNPEEVHHLITEPYDHLLVAETSCNFCWGSRWVHRSYDEVEKTYSLLDTAMTQMSQQF